MIAPLTIAISARQARWRIMALWGLSLLLLLLAIGTPAVTRTQEARVLETARQMLPRAWPEWLVPRLNDALRLQKPPLCYWITAGAFQVLGVSESVGRIPDALCGWLTLALVYRIGREWFDSFTGLVAAALLLSAYGFFRFTRLAETDGPSSMMVTLAVYALLRAERGSTAWLHVAAIAIAGAALAKGGPAGYPLLFLIGYSVLERRWRLLRRFFTSGAFAVALLLAGSWFVYVVQTHGRAVFATEIDNLTTGQNHGGWPWNYLPMAAEACAPWTGFVCIAVVNAIAQWGMDRGLRLVAIWFSSIALPLCLVGNKQPHYLLPTLPPLMLMTARTLTTRWNASDAWKTSLDVALMLIPALGCASIVAMVLFSIQQRGHLTAVDGYAMLGVFVLSGMILLARLRVGLPRAIVVAIVLWCLLIPLAVGRWLGSLVQYTPRSMAIAMHSQFGDGPFLFFGHNVSLPLCFHLRQEIDQADTLDNLYRQSKAGTIIIAIAKPTGAPPTLPQRFVPVFEISGGEQKVNGYRDAGGP